MASNIYYSAEEIEYMKQLYKEGFTARQIANAINEKFHNGATVRSPQSVKQKASRLGGISSVYCNRIFENNKTCKEVGANNAYNEKLKKDEVNLLYRKTLSAKKMLANRNPDIPMYLEKYEAWKSEANQFKQDIKSGKKDQEEFKQWLEQTKKTY